MIPERYSLNRIKEGIGNPGHLLGEFNRLTTTCNQLLSREEYNYSGIDVLSEDWDVMLILDACRFDTFSKINQIEGDLRPVESRGAETPEFLRGNFQNVSAYDTVYVSANAYIQDYFDVFHDVYPLYQEKWDDELNTVLPRAVTDRVLSAAERYPNKRIIGHYLQPHAPFTGEFGRELSVSDNWIWNQLRYGFDVSLTDIRKAYEENLKCALRSAEDVVDSLDCKVVITSDHGEMMGERQWPIPVRGYEHFEGIYTSELLTVPWHEPAFTQRRDIRSDPPRETDELDDGEIEEKLRALGYR